jgi:hypothetical protein
MPSWTGKPLPKSCRWRRASQHRSCLGILRRLTAPSPRASSFENHFSPYSRYIRNKKAERDFSFRGCFRSRPIQDRAHSHNKDDKRNDKWPFFRTASGISFFKARFRSRSGFRKCFKVLLNTRFNIRRSAGSLALALRLS